MSDYPGFRPHVIEDTVRDSTSLVDHVAAMIARTSRGPELSALELIELGAVHVNDERSLNPARSLRSGDSIRLHSSPRRFALPSDLSARVTSETGDYVIVEKPAGYPSEPTVDNFRENLLSALADLRGQNLFLVNSIEIEDSGLVMLAKSLEAQARLKQAFAEGTIRRTVVAFTAQPLAPGEHAGFLVKSCDERRAKTEILTEGFTSWKIETGALEVVYRLEIELRSTRPAQLRESLARLGAPIVGDKKNGSPHVALELESQKAGPCLKVVKLEGCQRRN